MKKTEKIEIRLSHEDKERLNSIAEREGRTISQIVRGLIDKYMDLNSTTPERIQSRKKQWLTGLGSGLLGLMLGGLFMIYDPFNITKSDQEDVSPKVSKIVKVDYPIDDEGVQFPLPLVDQHQVSQTIEMGEDGKSYYEFSVVEQDNGHFTVKVTACIKKTDECVPSFETVLEVSKELPSNKELTDKQERWVEIGIF